MWSSSSITVVAHGHVDRVADGDNIGISILFSSDASRTIQTSATHGLTAGRLRV